MNDCKFKYLVTIYSENAKGKMCVDHIEETDLVSATRCVLTYKKRNYKPFSYMIEKVPVLDLK